MVVNMAKKKITDFKGFGKFLKEKRVKANLTQAQVAKALGYKTSQFVSNWERGLSTPPAFVIKKIAELYNINAKELVGLLIDITVIKITKEAKIS